jgi:hypothetical protein
LVSHQRDPNIYDAIPIYLADVAVRDGPPPNRVHVRVA